MPTALILKILHWVLTTATIAGVVWWARKHPNRSQEYPQQQRMPQVVPALGWLFLAMGSLMGLLSFTTTDVPLGAKISSVAILLGGVVFVLMYRNFYLTSRTYEVAFLSVLGNKHLLPSNEKALPVAAGNNTGYDRAKQFGDWNDADRDCQNTRAEVLQNESKVRTSFTTAKRCTVKGGKWVTTWDGRVHTSASTVQIDHTVPVHEAWGSGARGWTKAKRVAFYNDLGDHRTLSAQTSALNSAKQARGLGA